MKKKVFNADRVYVINHESNSIYNDVVQFNKSKMEEAQKSFDGFPKFDSRIMVDGKDGHILQQKGKE